MAITVKHLKVSTIPDGDDDSLILPSDWNDDHQLTGTIPVDNGGTGAATLTGYVKGNGTSAMTAATTIPNTDITGLGTASTKDAGSANGVATLDSGGKVPVSELPAAVLGALSYQGTWNASTNSPTLVSSTGTKGYYYVVSVAGNTNLNGITDWVVGDWAVFNGSVWQKVDNTDAVTSVNGYTGTVNLTYTDVGAFPATSTTGTGNVVLATGATQANPTISNYENFTPTTAPAYAEGRVWYDSTEKALAYYNDSSSIAVHISQDLIFKVINNTGSTIPNGSPVYITGTSSGQTYPNVALAKADVAATSAVIGLTNGAIANGATGYVSSQGTIDNVNTSTFTVGQVLYLSPYSAGQLMNTVPPTGITVQVGVATYIDASAGHIYVKQTTPLAVPASIITGTLGVDHGGTGATTLTGYVKGSGTSAMTASATIPTTDLSGTVTNAQLANSAITINGTSTSLGGSISVGTVTSVTGTSPVVSSGGNTPAISMPAATTSVSGYLTSTDWNTFNNKGSGTVTSVAATVPTGLSIAGSPVTTTGTLAITYTAGYAIPTTASQTNWDTAYTDRLKWDGGSTGLVAATGRTSLGATTVGGNFFTLTNPSAITFPRMNADNTVSALDAATFRTAIGAGTGSGTVTSVTGTAPVVSSGGTTPAISMAAATTSVSGYLTSTDWNTFNGKYSVGGALGTPSSGTLTNCTFPTLNQNTTGTASNVTGTVAISNGGTGQTTATAAFNALNPMTTTGDIMYEASPTTAARLGIGSTGQVLTVAGGLPSWANAVSSNITALGMYENSATISANYTIGTGNNAMSAGPITVNTGITVTVPTGSTWTIV
jgi:hypothetical protein